ncbi:MAG: hypothetical protein EBU57_11605 [Alphaproteobacteria bacterium]|nr:hypothetical protein [Alphaproteobacteria bacterium]
MRSRRQTGWRHLRLVQPQARPRSTCPGVIDERCGVQRHLETASKTMPAPSDWIYLNNFNELSEPVSARLPAGQGRAFRDAMERLVLALGEALKTAFGGDAFQHRMQSEGEAAQKALAASMKEIQDEARQHGLEIVQSPQGPMIIAVDEGGEAIDPDKMTDE